MRPMPELIKLSITHATFPLNYPTVMAISEHIVKQSENQDKIIVYYNEFKSAISSIVRTMELMPRNRFL
jgi:F0F1-type ATP synthase gamma subunit